MFKAVFHILVLFILCLPAFGVRNLKELASEIDSLALDGYRFDRHLMTVEKVKEIHKELLDLKASGDVGLFPDPEFYTREGFKNHYEDLLDRAYRKEYLENKMLKAALLLSKLHSYRPDLDQNELRGGENHFDVYRYVCKELDVAICLNCFALECLMKNDARSDYILETYAGMLRMRLLTFQYEKIGAIDANGRIQNDILQDNDLDHNQTRRGHTYTCLKDAINDGAPKEAYYCMGLFLDKFGYTAIADDEKKQLLTLCKEHYLSSQGSSNANPGEEEAKRHQNLAYVARPNADKRAYMESLLTDGEGHFDNDSQNGLDGDEDEGPDIAPMQDGELEGPPEEDFENSGPESDQEDHLPEGLDGNNSYPDLFLEQHKLQQESNDESQEDTQGSELMLRNSDFLLEQEQVKEVVESGCGASSSSVTTSSSSPLKRKRILFDDNLLPPYKLFMSCKNPTEADYDKLVKNVMESENPPISRKNAKNRIKVYASQHEAVKIKLTKSDPKRVISNFWDQFKQKQVIEYDEAFKKLLSIKNGEYNKTLVSVSNQTSYKCKTCITKRTNGTCDLCNRIRHFHDYVKERQRLTKER